MQVFCCLYFNACAYDADIRKIPVLHVVCSDSTAQGTHYKPANVAFCELNYKVANRHLLEWLSAANVIILPDCPKKLYLVPTSIYAYAYW